MQARDGLKKTPLYDLHVEQGARMVPFAGYDMPVQYPSGILAEHRQTRESAGLFDVSHMGQVRLSASGGREAAASALEKLVPAAMTTLQSGRMRYTQFTNDQGGILDDLMVTAMGDHLYLVVNAACKDADIAHLEANLGDSCEIEVLTDRALLALQGPKAVAAFARLVPECEQLSFMQAATWDLDGDRLLVSRSGYTGEDGVEVSVPGHAAEAMARRLLDMPEVELIGLGARDSLRLEAGLCLYGHDIDTTTTPIEAGLIWSIQKSRRDGGDYPGAAVIERQIKDGTDRRLVGLKPEGRAPVRDGAEIVEDDGNVIGAITSGGFGATAGGPVAMGYVPSDRTEPGERLNALVRGKTLPIDVTAMPFVPHRYHRT